MENARSALTERSSFSNAATLGDVGVIGVVGCERVEGVCRRSGVDSEGTVAAFHLKNEAKAPGDLAQGKGLSRVGFANSFGGIVMGAGGASAAVISFSELRALRFTGVGIELRRGRVVAVAACCNFFDDSARLRSSFDLRGSFDGGTGGEFGDEGGEGS